MNKWIPLTWEDVYKKYKHSELMEGLKKTYIKIKHPELYKSGVETMAIDHLTIQDIWGYLIVFAETKGYWMRLYFIQLNQTAGELRHKELGQIEVSDEMKDMEQAMIWCTDKFFEVAK